MKNKQNLSALKAQLNDLSLSHLMNVKGGNSNSSDALTLSQTASSTSPLPIVFSTVANQMGAEKNSATSVQSDDKRRQRPGGGISTH